VKTLSWYENTLFVITADHTNQSTHEEYKTDLGVFEVPIIFYTPDGSLPAIVREDVIAQQIDIMPTVLSYLGRTDAFMAFGNDLLTTPANETFAVNYNNGIYQLVMGDYLLQFDGNNTRAIYNFKHDRLLKENLLGKVTLQPEMEHFLKAIIQQYMQRMNTDNLVVR
jgi:arylsulfatase A-like enzyme